MCHLCGALPLDDESAVGQLRAGKVETRVVLRTQTHCRLCHSNKVCKDVVNTAAEIETI